MHPVAKRLATPMRNEMGRMQSRRDAQTAGPRRIVDVDASSVFTNL
jgi:hypothetical protein